MDKREAHAFQKGIPGKVVVVEVRLQPIDIVDGRCYEDIIYEISNIPV